MSLAAGDGVRSANAGGFAKKRSGLDQDLLGEIPHGSLAFACSPEAQQTMPGLHSCESSPM